MVSVIIPTYNRATQLRRCLLSLTKQTYRDFEVIVCDDGSTDNTQEVVSEFIQQLNIRYDNDVNFGGPAKPRNRGIKSSTGEFIAFLDSDDWWYPQKLEQSMSKITDADLVYHNLTVYKQDNIPGSELKLLNISGNIFKNLIIWGNSIPNSSVIVRKSILEKVGFLSEDKNLIAVEDHDLWIRIAQITNKFSYISESLGAYWINDANNNISSSIKQITRAEYLLAKYYHYLSPSEKVLAISIKNFNNGRLYQSFKQFGDAKTSYLKALKTTSIVIKVKALIGFISSFVKITI